MDANTTAGRIRCGWTMCGEYFRLSTFDDHWRAHSTAEQTGCRWTTCNSQAKNLKQHVHDTHLGLRYVCGQCYRADFGTLRSLVRHQEQQGGCVAAITSPVLCAHCGLDWPSQAAMNKHAPFCVGAGIFRNLN